MISPDQDLPQEPSNAKETLIKNLRSKLEDLIPENEKFSSDLYLFHWLRGWKMNVESTETAIRNALKWRKEKGMDELAKSEYPEDYSNYFTFEYVRGKNGQLVVLWPLGSWDVKGFTDKYGNEAFINYMLQENMKREQKLIEHTLEFQKAKAQTLDSSSESGEAKEIEGITLVISGSGYCRKKSRLLQTIKTAIDVAKIINVNFPQSVDNLYFINVNKFFLMMMKMIQPFINVPRLEIFDNEEKWKPILHELVDIDKLSVEFGGVAPENENEGENENEKDKTSASSSSSAIPVTGDNNNNNIVS